MPLSHHRVIILGTGPAGYTAGIYAARAGLEPLIFEGAQPGGQLTITTEIENFPGFREGIPGPALMDEMRQQALRFGASIQAETVVEAELGQRPFRLRTEGAEYTCDALVIATGASARWLGLGKDEALSRSGGGVSACATCDGFFYRGREIAVVGGGDTALEEALHLTRFASRVNLIHRRDAFRASRAMQARVLSHDKIAIHWNQVVEDILTTRLELAGGGQQERIRALALRDTTDGSRRELPVEGLFVAVGHRPNTELFRGQLPLDGQGYLIAEPGSSRTAVPGVFACGDVRDANYRQAITAAGSGCMAGIDCERWLGEQSLAE